MPSEPRANAPQNELLQILLHGPTAGAARTGLMLHLHELRHGGAMAEEDIDQTLLNAIAKVRAGLNQATKAQNELRELIEKITRPPWFPAMFLETMVVDGEPVALVVQPGGRRFVGFGPDVSPEGLRSGDEVLLSHDHNLVVEKSSRALLHGGELARFERHTADGRMLLNFRDEEVLVTAGGSLPETELSRGDLVRWSRDAELALEKIDRSEGRHHFLEDTPAETFADIGGLDSQIGALTDMMLIDIMGRREASLYQLQRRGSVLLTGPPGTGKTMMARACANWLSTQTPSGRSRFMNVKPGGLGSVWYSQTEANLREVFAVARQAGEDEPDVPVVMFFDEIDGLGGARGRSHNTVEDRVLDAFMVELDGLGDRGNVFVIAATNRPDILDSGLMRAGRLRDNVIEVPRPASEGARAIFGRYLNAEIPYEHNGEGAESARRTLIDSMVSRLYAANGETDLVWLTFRDGKQHLVQIRHLLSGADIARICREGLETACRRDVASGGDERGLRLEDLLPAAAGVVEELTRLLTPQNCAMYLTDLPSGLDVVRVEPIRKKAPRTYRYLETA